jgi:hypothetical protein
MYNVSVDGGPPDSWPERSDDIVYNMHSDPAPAYVNSLLVSTSLSPEACCSCSRPLAVSTQQAADWRSLCRIDADICHVGYLL